MDWTPEEIRKLVNRVGGIEVMAEIMRVTPKTIQNMIYGDKPPSKAAGIAILNLIEILSDNLNPTQFKTIIGQLLHENSKTPIRERRS